MVLVSQENSIISMLAARDYSAMKEDEISVKQGDVLQILATNSEGLLNFVYYIKCKVVIVWPFTDFTNRAFVQLLLFDNCKVISWTLTSLSSMAHTSFKKLGELYVLMITDSVSVDVEWPSGLESTVFKNGKSHA